jgi:hypothetical protein
LSEVVSAGIVTPVTLGIGKQNELPRRPGDYRTAKGEMNKVPESADVEATEMKARNADHALKAEEDLRADRGLLRGILSLFRLGRK